jgi:AcrR family transcriptional regulator
MHVYDQPMSPRLPSVTDDDIFAAVHRAMQTRGPHELTLAHIAAEAGVTAGRLVQRFGGKRELLLALSDRFAGSAPALFASLRAAHRSPLAVIHAYASCMAGLAASAPALARNLAYLHVDLADADFRRPLVQNARDTRAALARLVREAVAAEELTAATPAARLARTLETAVSGSLMTWACYQEGAAAAWLRQDVAAVLAPYRPARLRRSARRP